VVATADTEDGATLGHNVGAGEILGETQWMPHRRDVEAAAQFEMLGEMTEMHCRHQKVG
jgi:hypothetical protein